MKTLCSWCNQPLIDNWIRVKDIWVHSECMVEIVAVTDAYIEKEKKTEEVIDDLYSPRK